MAAEAWRQTCGDLARYLAGLRANTALVGGRLDARRFWLDVLGCLNEASRD